MATVVKFKELKTKEKLEAISRITNNDVYSIVGEIGNHVYDVICKSKLFRSFFDYNENGDLIPMANKTNIVLMNKSKVFNEIEEIFKIQKSEYIEKLNAKSFLYNDVQLLLVNDVINYLSDRIMCDKLDEYLESNCSEDINNILCYDDGFVLTDEQKKEYNKFIIIESII